MPNLTVNFACELYDRVFPLYAGEVKPRGVDLNFVAVGRARTMESPSGPHRSRSRSWTGF